MVPTPKGDTATWTAWANARPTAGHGHLENYCTTKIIKKKKKKNKNQKPWRGKELDHDRWAQCFASTTLNGVRIDTPYVTVGSSSQSTVLWGFYWNRSKRWKKRQHMRIQMQTTTLPGDNYSRLPPCSSCPSPQGLGATPTRNRNHGRQCTLKGFT